MHDHKSVIPSFDVIYAKFEPDGSWTYARESVWKAFSHNLGVLIFLYPREAGRVAALLGVAGACLYLAIKPLKPQETRV